MGRALVILSGILVLALMAGGLTETTLALGHRGGISDDAALRPRGGVTPSPSATPTPSPAASVAPSATPVPAATPSPSPVISGPSAVTNSFVRLRAGKSTATAVLDELDGGTRVELLNDSDAQWQQVRYNGQVGYIFKSYLTY